MVCRFRRFKIPQGRGGGHGGSNFKMIYVDFHPWDFMFFYVIIKIFMPSTTVSLNVRTILHTF